LSTLDRLKNRTQTTARPFGNAGFRWVFAKHKSRGPKPACAAVKPHSSAVLTATNERFWGLPAGNQPGKSASGRD
jgi:hypothetical protein